MKVSTVPDLRFSNEIWQPYKLKVLCDSCGGGTPSTQNTAFWSGNIPWISSSDLNDNVFDINVRKFITHEAINNSATKIIPKNSIVVVTRVGLGKLAINNFDLCTSQDFCSLKNIKTNIIFTTYSLKNKLNYLIKQSQGTSIKGITTNELLNIVINCPSSDMQLKIANFVCKIDKRIETQKKIISNIESQIKSIKSVLLNSNDGCKKALIDILEEISFKSTINNQYPIISSTIKGLVLQSEYFGKKIASSDNIGYKIITRNNIIISPQNLWMGNITFNDKFERGIVSPSYKIFNIKEDYNKLYIFELMTTTKAFYLYNTVSEQGASVVRRNLNFEAFMQLSFNIPSLEVQNKTINALNCFKNKYNNEKKILSLYEQQKQYLLNHMFI